MIVISGALAVVAFVLLIAGLVQSGLGLVYASIAVSLVSAVFLGVGAYQRRGEEVGLPATSGGAEAATDEEVTRVVPVAPSAPAEEPAFAFATPDGEEAASGASSAGGVLVVPGRPRYHVAGCRYLVGKDGEERSLAEARNEGYTACGICRPDENLGTAASLEPAFAGASDDDVPAASRSRSRTTARKSTRSTRSTAKKAPAKSTAKRSASSTTKKTAAKKSTGTKRTASTSSSRSSTKKAATKKAATSTTKKAATKKTAAKKSTAKKTTRKR